MLRSNLQSCTCNWDLRKQEFGPWRYDAKLRCHFGIMGNPWLDPCTCRKLSARFGKTLADFWDWANYNKLGTATKSAGNRQVNQPFFVLGSCDLRSRFETIKIQTAFECVIVGPTDHPSDGKMGGLNIYVTWFFMPFTLKPNLVFCHMAFLMVLLRYVNF